MFTQASAPITSQGYAQQRSATPPLVIARPVPRALREILVRYYWNARGGRGLGVAEGDDHGRPLGVGDGLVGLDPPGDLADQPVMVAPPVILGPPGGSQPSRQSDLSADTGRRVLV